MKRIQTLFDIYNYYCIWTHREDWSDKVSTSNSESVRDVYQFKDSFDSLINERNNKLRTRRRKNPVLDVSKCVLKIQEWIFREPFRYITGRVKPRSSKLDEENNRSSTFIGVSKNGDNWQVLINNGKFKKYIGTYSNEKIAAITYDFYAICLKLSKAKTNFSYSSELITEMIQCYNFNTKKFDASSFVNRL